MPKYSEKLISQEIWVIMFPMRKVAIENGCVSGSKIIEKVHNYRHWTDKAEDAA